LKLFIDAVGVYYYVERVGVLIRSELFFEDAEELLSESFVEVWSAGLTVLSDDAVCDFARVVAFVHHDPLDLASAEVDVEQQHR